jgi:hypothetical protein
VTSAALLTINSVSLSFYFLHTLFSALILLLFCGLSQNALQFRERYKQPRLIECVYYLLQSLSLSGSIFLLLLIFQIVLLFL